MIPVTQNDLTENTTESRFAGFNLETIQAYVSGFTDRVRSLLPNSTTPEADIEMGTTDATEQTQNVSSFNLQAIQAYVSSATQYLTPSTERVQAVSDYVTAIPARVQAVPEALSQGCETVSGYARSVSDYCSANKEMLAKGAGALLLVGVIITCSTGPATCSTFHVINRTGDTLEISYLSPYSASFSDANSKSHKNHPIWKPKGFLETGMVSVDKGYSSETVMHVEEAYNWFADPFTINLKSEGVGDVKGNPNLHLTTFEKGFFVCTTELRNGPPPAPSNDTVSATSYLRA
jgi:hypothetical protein